MKGREKGVLLCDDECESVSLVLWDCLVNESTNDTKMSLYIKLICRKLNKLIIRLACEVVHRMGSQ